MTGTRCRTAGPANVIENEPVVIERALEQGRAAYANRAWTDAFAALSRANRELPLEAADLELLAHSAYMLGLDDDYRAALEQAYRAFLDAGDASRAARCAWWIGHNLLFLGQAAPARGWFARGQRLRALTGSRGHRLLQHDRVLSRRVRAPSRARVDG